MKKLPTIKQTVNESEFKEGMSQLGIDVKPFHLRKESLMFIILALACEIENLSEQESELCSP